MGRRGNFYSENINQIRTFLFSLLGYYRFWGLLNLLNIHTRFMTSGFFIRRCHLNPCFITFRFKFDWKFPKIFEFESPSAQWLSAQNHFYFKDRSDFKHGWYRPCVLQINMYNCIPHYVWKGSGKLSNEVCLILCKKIIPRCSLWRLTKFWGMADGAYPNSELWPIAHSQILPRSIWHTTKFSALAHST